MAVLLIAVLACPVFALSFTAKYTVTNNGTTDYDMLGVFVYTNNQWLVDNSYITPDATDVYVSSLPRLLTDNMTWVAVALPPASQKNLTYSSNNTPANFDIILGNGGYATLADNSTYEVTNNFTLTLSDTWIDTDAGLNKWIVYKESAINFGTSNTTTGNVTFSIVGGASVSAIALLSAEYDVIVTANTTHLMIYVNGILKDTAVMTANVTDNANSWILFSGNTTRYVGSLTLEK